MSNDKSENSGCAVRFGNWKTLLLGVPTMIIGYAIHGSIPWAVFDMVFWPLVWIKWLICNEVTIEIIEQAFKFLS
jgi:hypothetical protein